jgi:hypothetical protein
MKGTKLYAVLGLAFLAVSALLYAVHYLIFGDLHHILIYLLGDIAFLPLEVFLVVIVLERILARREKQAVLYKLNMAIGAFFSEVGNALLADLLAYFKNRDEISRRFDVKAGWTDKDHACAADFARRLKIEVDMARLDLGALKQFLSAKRPYLLTLLENPNLLEHDRFTDLLWATTHVDEELEARPRLSDLPKEDLAHLAGDIQRMYDHLAGEWIDHVQHLKSAYPFLFSLVLRTHPFQENPSAVVRGGY